MTHTADKLAIMDVLARYARGIDRCDIDTLNSIWAEGATADFGSGSGDARAWAAATITALRGMLRTQHMLGQMIIDIDGDRATAETYCQAYHEVEGPDGRIEMVVGGRYLDDLARTAGGWYISHRRYAMDWNRNMASTAQWDGALYGTLARVGQRAPDDALYNGR